MLNALKVAAAVSSKVAIAQALEARNQHEARLIGINLT